MSATFLERNKKKSLLAALLLFLRQRKILVLLLFLVLMASTVFLSPSSWITSFPGGQRFAAGVAWIAGKMGFDVSKWGLGPGKHSYDDLLAAFKAAKSSGNGGGVGWGPFFGRGGASGAGAGGANGAPSSLDFVKGSKSDLDHGVGAGADAGGAGAGVQTVAGIVDPSDPKNKGNDAVAIGNEDLGGERESLAGGFMKGLFGGGGGPGSSGDASLSGGAFANKGFFSGNGGAAGASNTLAKAGLAGFPPLSTPSSTKGGAAVGKLSSMASHAVDARGQKGILAAASLGGNLAYTQLAEGNSRAQLGTQYCKPPDCPSEFAATNSGAIYDGNNISAGMLTSSDPGGNSSGLINSTVNVPPDDSGGITGGGAVGDAQNMQTCADQMKACGTSRTAPMKAEGADETQLQNWYGQMAGACGDPCHCGPCDDLKGKISGLCNGDLAVQMKLSDAPCAPLPDYCAALGFSNTDPSSSANTSGQDLCKQDVGQCGCNGSFFCGLGCFFGS